MSKELITKFYEAFKSGEGETMASMYHQDALFSDPVFQNLNGTEAGAMWQMLIERAKGDLKIEFHSVEDTEDETTCVWEARYRFSKTGRPVHNVIKSTMIFLDGEIINHQDEFDFWKWSRMALGAPGVFLGWTPIIKNKVQDMAKKGLEDYLNANAK